MLGFPNSYHCAEAADGFRLSHDSAIQLMPVSGAEPNESDTRWFPDGTFRTDGPSQCDRSPRNAVLPRAVRARADSVLKFCSDASP